ncbi:MAG: transcription-repair coupling factor [Treponema sp.]|jgi:transcription-repair coupling factor (superfamily II helicase)|nr:transcription-repair coupling factor [Treponema sp.]
MNTLSFTSLLQKINSVKSVSTGISAVKEGKFPLEIEGCEGAFGAMLMAKIYSARPGRYFIVIPQEIDAAEFAADLDSLRDPMGPRDPQGPNFPCLLFPGWGAAPYRELAPLSAVFGERIKALSDLVMDKPGIVVIPQRAFISPLPPPDYIKSLLIPIKPGAKIDTTELSKKLISYGYIRVPRVQVRGEFALRGEVLDIFMGNDSESGTGTEAETEAEAFRVLFDFDRVESVKRFNPQGSGTGKEKVSELLIRPMRELVWTDDRIEALSVNLSACSEFSDGGKAIIEELITKRSFAGEEMFFPLAFKNLTTEKREEEEFTTELHGVTRRKKQILFPPCPPCPPWFNILDYLGNDGTLVLIDRERLDNAQESISREYQGLYMRSHRDEESREFPLPDRLLLNFRELIERYQSHKDKAGKLISFLSIKSEARPGVSRINIPCEPSRSFFGNINYMKDEFDSLHASGWHIAVAAESEVQAQRIESMLVPHKSLSIIARPLSSGFSLPEIKLMVIQENEIFGRRKRPPRSLKTVRSSPIDTFVELNPGDYVVHVNHGIGLFKGIERINALGFERDYIQLEYAGDETVFVPVEQLNMVQRYIGSEGNPPRLDTIGSKSWENRKGRVKKSVEEIAQRLLDLYSRRKKAIGYAFPKDTEWQTMFEAAFPFEETEDQLRCVEEIKRDMESSSPMDRLVCGDVGYGKTEVAVRACFKAIMGGKQAAFLAPTTILAEQHYENFKERFSIFPVRIAMLSRFVDQKNVRATLGQLKNGEIDLLIGTHRIIQRDVSFKNLGLIVIDEEQRFGVKDKERLKELKNNVDCLTLSATPIPRTLHMSLLKIRDMSLLATAPSGRQPIETVIEEYSDERLVKAIRGEVERGGQVFFLHNRIETLRDIRIRIERLVPEILAETAHGQMDAQDLEDVMHRFVHGGFHVLVSTTIIENGIDIPNVNTIIIDRADMYGVSQLYQLRGRVGRSDRVAYAYLLYPQGGEITELAMKRLQVISDFTELGSGFKIAMKDMEIRGAGNLLGREQSGDIYSVGFDLYLKLLDEAVRRLENSSYEAEMETLLELEYSGFIPDSYIDSQQEKMEVYKMIAGIRDKEELERVYADLQDRFGPPPDEAASLLALAEIRIICRGLAVSSLREREGIVRVEFAKVSHVKVDRLIRLMQESLGKVKLDPKKPNVLLLTVGNIGLQEKSEFIREKLAALA